MQVQPIPSTLSRLGSYSLPALNRLDLSSETGSVK